MEQPTKRGQLDIQIGDVTPANIMQLRTINVHTLPVKYTDKFYTDLAVQGFKEYMKFACWNGFNVGAVCARIEPIEDSDNKKLYIMTLNVLPAYRRRGIATCLLNHVLKTAKENSSIVEVYLHVQTSNEDALKFYTASGFNNEGVIENYYKRIEPPHCYILKMSMSQVQTTQNPVVDPVTIVDANQTEEK